ncbi:MULTISPECIES: class I SAM-dependent methyltransferase [Streptosporangium]|uniref:SAM-dependent methyltransferase n=1 Tax=Streptosporangium brasiliense TaxID=47480 RepID=A0ABT9R373_9ACTN|nr:class I SAM-dependent methyltransferase [Streptosporangium brasiliense]MDP9863672.1 SAM-dependent methyltransferase [Streptosporangium brasiliense]
MTQQLVERYGDGVFNHATVTEDERLNALSQELDPASFRRLESLPFRSDWRCLELGAGTGTVARRLAERCPRGTVVATDLDLGLVGDRYGERANLSWLQHDLTRDDFPPGSSTSSTPATCSAICAAGNWTSPGSSAGWPPAAG